MLKINDASIPRWPISHEIRKNHIFVNIFQLDYVCILPANAVLHLTVEQPLFIMARFCRGNNAFIVIVTGSIEPISSEDGSEAFMRQLYSFYSDAFCIAVKSIFEHKLRAFLTLIGIIIGVAAVVVVGASISGLNSYVIDKVSKVLGVKPFYDDPDGIVGRMYDEEFERRNRRNKDVDDGRVRIRQGKLSNCSEVGAQMNAGTDLKRERSRNALRRGLSGSPPIWSRSKKKPSTLRRFISNDEVTRSAKVAVIGYDIKDKFFPNSDPLGQTIKIRGVPVEIVGIEEKRGSMFGDSLDRQIYIPLTLHQLIFNRAGRRTDPWQICQSREFLKMAIEDARTVLRNKRQLIGSEEDTFGACKYPGLRIKWTNSRRPLPVSSFPSRLSF